MRNIIIQVGLSFILMASTSCALFGDAAPTFPDVIKKYYLTDIAQLEHGIVVSCFEYDIVSVHPFILSEHPRLAADLKLCDQVGGLQHDDSVLFYNFVDDSIDWMIKKEKQKCTP